MTVLAFKVYADLERILWAEGISVKESDLIPSTRISSVFMSFSVEIITIYYIITQIGSEFNIKRGNR